jgi:DNA-binding MurR/RpiR family transcriptional regulator
MASTEQERDRGKSTQRPRGALARLNRDLESFREAERQVAEVFMSMPADVVSLSVTEVADRANVSDATVVRFCQSLGFSGFAEFKIQLASEITEPFEFIHADIQESDGPIEILDKVLQSDMQTLYDTLSVLDRKSFTKAVHSIATSSELSFFGVGTSAPIAIDASYRFEQLGIPSRAMTDSIQMAVAALHVKKGVTVIGISHSGATRATLDALELAGQAGATTICITSFQRSPMVSASEIALVVAAREISYRFEALASRLAHLAVLDALNIAVAHLEIDASLHHLKRSAEIIARHRF